MGIVIVMVTVRLVRERMDLMRTGREMRMLRETCAIVRAYGMLVKGEKQEANHVPGTGCPDTKTGVGCPFINMAG